MSIYFDDGYAQSPISLAFLDENNDARYSFLSPFSTETARLLGLLSKRPRYLRLLLCRRSPVARKIQEFISYAREQNAIIYYDINFRKSHAHEAMRIMPAFIENLEYADIVRGSAEDFETLLNETDAEKLYRNRISFDTPNFIYTDGANGVDIFCRTGHSHIDTPPIKTLSTIGAGDNFNAGILFGLLQNDVSREQLSGLSLEKWIKVISHGISFASEVCQSYENYISPEFVLRYKQEHR